MYRTHLFILSILVCLFLLLQGQSFKLSFIPSSCNIDLLLSLSDILVIVAVQDLGKIKYIRLWHDNTGANPSWFVSRICVTNIVTNIQTQFLCNSWMGIALGGGKIDRVFLAAEQSELKSFEAIFFAKASQGFTDDHLWFSVPMRSPRSNFTRVQRVSCCLCVLICTMLANAMFYRTNFKVAGTGIQVGSFNFNWKQIIIGIESSLIVLPLSLLIVLLFRKAAPASIAKKQDKDTCVRSVVVAGKQHRKHNTKGDMPDQEGSTKKGGKKVDKSGNSNEFKLICPEDVTVQLKGVDGGKAKISIPLISA